MKTAAFAVLSAVTLSLGACAPGAQNLPAPDWLNADAPVQEGWIRVTGEEFRLYRDQNDLRRGPAVACVSGALPQNAQRAAGDLTGGKVRVFGRTTEWSGRDGAQTLNWQGSRINNGCGRAVVILADRVEVIR
ncbi:MAG: hypothetical protein K2X07_00805 [Caulobacteraceae bacterium]|nr:hypothetical protein [Caulobacteraceae bacterium]